jgi:hypothetical protein
MPYIFYRCDTCRRKESLWLDYVMDNEDCPAENCGGHLRWFRIVYGNPPSGRDAQGFTPIVLFRDPSTGEYRVPGIATEGTPPGFERAELRTLAELERVTKQMSARGRAEAERLHHEKHEAIGKVKAELHAELRNEMRHMSGAALEFAEAALARSEARQTKRAFSGEVVNHVLEYDSSNREAWRDQRTGWRGKRS